MDERREQTILGAISSTEPSTFKEFLNGLDGDVPSERSEWSEMFADLRNLESRGLVEVSRAGSQIDSLQLTADGVARIKELRK
jgi:hypothetical protein